MYLPQIEPILSLEIVDQIALREPIRDAYDAVQYLGELALCHPVERVYAIFLAANLRPIAYECGGVGNHHRALVDVRGIVTSALLLHAEAIILVHTHPVLSSQPKTPSQRDIRTTKKLREILAFFGMTLLDSFILEHCNDDTDGISLTSITKWIEDTEYANETEESEPEKEVAHT